MIIKAIYIKVGMNPEIIEIDNSLNNLQVLVGGNIEMISPIEKDVDIVINEEGKLLGLNINKLLVHNNDVVDVLAGNILIVGVDLKSGATISLSESKISKYFDMFKHDIINI